MADLNDISGLPIYLNDQYKIDFVNSDLRVEFETRKAGDMAKVIYKYDPSIADQDLYYMYRDVAYKNDREEFKFNNLRYDLTVMRPESLTVEYNKTKGHYHPKGVNGVCYPEVYEVLLGVAKYLLQKPNDNDLGVIEEALLATVKAGEKILIPPGYGHVTINPGPDPLVMSDWVSNQFSSNYQPYLNYKGGCCYLLKNDTVSKNPNYKSMPEIRKVVPAELPQFGLISNYPVYEVAKTDIKRLDFLNNPEKYNLEINQIFKDGQD